MQRAGRASRVALLGLSVAWTGCGAAGAHAVPADGADLGRIADDLFAMGPELSPVARRTFRAVLEDTIAKDAYTCLPPPRDVFFGSEPIGERTIRGVMPHYGFWLGPMHYTVRREAGRSEVRVLVAIEPPPESATLELPDCKLARELVGPVSCSGTPYPEARGREACPESGRFTAPALRSNVRALLARWSREAQEYYNRDARAFGLPVSYDFEFVIAGEVDPASARAHATLPLATTCARTPYFSAMRSGWSLPVVAHEMGHFLGLLDEYETLSGIVAAYPKTPFPGAEISRMGLSMKEGTGVLPIHHYLVLRRALCDEPRHRDPYGYAP